MNTHIGAVSFVDAGPITVAARADMVADQAALDQAAVTAWQGLNSHPGIVSVVNRGDSGGYENMWGSVIAYVHWANATSIHGLHYQPTTFDDPIAGLSGINPPVTFNPRNTAGAVALRHENLSSLIVWEGSDYLYGGRTRHDANDPRRVLRLRHYQQRHGRQRPAGHRSVPGHRQHPEQPGKRCGCIFSATLTPTT